MNPAGRGPLHPHDWHGERNDTIPPTGRGADVAGEAPDEPTGPSPWRAILLIGVAAAGAALWLGGWLFPNSSPIVDERVYLQESIAIGAGRLTLPPEFHPDHRPFLTYPNDRGELMFKYPPLWPAVLAAADALTGTSRAAVPVVVLAFTTGVGALAWQLVGRRRVATLAAGLAGACPLVLVLGASRLAYVFSAALLVWAAAALLAGGRSSRRRWMVAGGLLAGLALFARPLDAVIVVGPVAVWVWWIGRRGRRALEFVAFAALGAVPPLAALLWTNWRITGGALRLPYSAVGPRDALGYGLRLDVHDGTPFHFTFADGLATLGRGLGASLRWMPLSVVGIAALVFGVVLAGRRVGVLLGVLAGAVPLVYVAFWGAWNGYIRLDTTALVGPMYYVPAVAPVCVAAAVTLDRAPRRAAAALLAAGLVMGAVGVSPAINRLRDGRADLANRAAFLDRMADAGGGTRSLLIVDAENLLYRYPLYNEVPLGGTRVGAVDIPGRGVELLNRFPEHTAVRATRRYVLEGRPGVATERDGLGFSRQTVIEPLQMRTARAPSARVRMQGEILPVDRLVVRFCGRALTWTPTSAQLTVSVAGQAVTADGRPPEREERAATPPGQLCVGRIAGSLAEPADGFDEVCFDTGKSSEGWQIVTPGRPATRFAVGRPVMLAADVSDRITVEWGNGQS